MLESWLEFLSFGSGLKQPSDLTKLLEALAEKAGADAAVFWRLTEGSVLTQEKQTGTFFPVASWCRFYDVMPWYYLPVDSVTGRAWLERERQPFRLITKIDDAREIARDTRELLVDRWEMISCASVPIWGGDGEPCAITFYARQRPIESKKLDATVQLVKELPTLYSLLGDTQALSFLAELNDTLHGTGENAESRPTTLDEGRKRLKAVCDLLTKHFNAVEASIILTEDRRRASAFRIQASAWNWPRPPTITEYVPGQSLTGWVLQNRRPLRILDLAKYVEDREWLRRQYPNLEWPGEENVKQQLRGKFQLPPETPDCDLPPASFMCAPVLHGKLLLGVVRCCTRETSPSSFEEVDLRVCQLTASFIGGWWDDLLEYVNLEEDSRQLQRLVNSVTQLHRKAGETLVSERKDVGVLLEMTLKKAMESIPAVDHGDVRLVNAERTALYYKVTRGELWTQGSQKAIAERTMRMFPLDERSAGSYVVNREEAHIVNDPEKDPWDLKVLDGVRKRVYVPIRGGGAVLGVLDLGRTQELDFTKWDAAVAENFAAQMGLYIHLHNQFEQRLRAQKKSREEQESQLRTFENLRHQVYGPTGAAAMALERICKMPGVPAEIRRDLSLARGEALRASIMVRSLELFAALASDRLPRVKEEQLTAEWLKYRLDELATHQGYLAPETQRLTFTVIEKGLEGLKHNPVYCDLNLLEHAASNLLENARKYSGKGTTIQVQCGFMDHDKMFYIAVQNSGLKIDPNDVPKMTTRGWRSDSAWKVVAEGTGIGLYVIDSIMKAHGGRVQIMPTNANNVHEVRLIFPVGTKG